LVLEFHHLVDAVDEHLLVLRLGHVGAGETVGDVDLLVDC